MAAATTTHGGKRPHKLPGLVLGMLGAFWFIAPQAHGQAVHRNKFEASSTFWVKAGFDAPHEVTAHASSDRGAHDGARCEYIQLQTKAGTFIYYEYATGKAPISEELSGSIYLKSNRPGVQLMARVVLPNERDPMNLDNRLVTFIRGDAYRNAGRWQRLDLGRAVQAAKQQQTLMQAQLKRAVDFTGAYVDALVLNVYAGPGPTEVWIDDLEVGPLAPGSTPEAVRAPIGKTVAAPRPARTQAVEFNGSQLLVGGRRFFFRGTNYSDTPLQALRDAGFNTLFVDPSISKAALQDAIDKGFWISPKLKVFGDDGAAVPQETLAREVARFAESDALVFWHVANTLAFEQAPAVARAAQDARQRSRPTHRRRRLGRHAPFSRSLNLVGVHRWPLSDARIVRLSADGSRLEGRGFALTNPGTFTWT
ncbi:MAG: hypothetical protein U0793_34260 [Gemmataceae bacterium]